MCLKCFQVATVRFSSQVRALITLTLLMLDHIVESESVLFVVVV